MAKYEMYTDGKERTSVHAKASFTFTREEMTELDRKAKAMGYDDFRQYCVYAMPDFITKLDDELAYAGKH